MPEAELSQAVDIWHWQVVCHGRLFGLRVSGERLQFTIFMAMVPAHRSRSPAAANQRRPQPQAARQAERPHPRFGSLAKEYYDILEHLPGDALPTVPPRATHVYDIVKRTGGVYITVNLKKKLFSVRHPQYEPMTYDVSMRQVGGTNYSWLLAKSVSLAWAKLLIAEGPNVMLTRVREVLDGVIDELKG